MKTPVSDKSVDEYARSLRAGGPLAKVFPGPISECDFTEHQRVVIKEARREHKALIREAKAAGNKSSSPVLATRSTAAQELAPQGKPLTKLRRLLYLQSGRCFFCGEQLSEELASIEHLLAKKWGGKSEEWNEVVCHSSLNATFGSMDLRSKFDFVVKSAGKFRCPK